MKKKKLFSLVLATVLTAATVLPCYGASTKEKISNAQAEQAAAQSQLDSIQSRIDELNSKKGQSEEYLSELNQQLDDLQRGFRISMMRSRTNWYRFRQIWKMQKQKKKSSTRR